MFLQALRRLRVHGIVMRFYISFINEAFDDLADDEKQEVARISSGAFMDCDVRPVVGDKLQFWSTNENTLYTAIVREVRISGAIKSVDGAFLLDCTEQHEIDLEWFDVA
jgi:hypothetical protein